MASEKKDCTICDKVGLRPLTKENIFYYYLPMHGGISYFALSANVMNPNLFGRLLPKKDITNVLLMSTIIGTSFYIYGRPHMRAISNKKRATYAAVGSCLFSMGSVLLWAVIKSGLPKDNAFLATLAGLGTGAILVKVSSDYFADTDKLTEGKN